jgi:hypothetical protein
MWQVVSVIGVLQAIASCRRPRTLLQDPLSRASVAAPVTEGIAGVGAALAILIA